MEPNDTVERHWNKMKEAVKKTAMEVIGEKKNKPQKEWVSQEVLQLCKQRREIRIDETDKHQINWITRKMKRKLKGDKENWLQSTCKETQNS